MTCVLKVSLNDKFQRGLDGVVCILFLLVVYCRYPCMWQTTLAHLLAVSAGRTALQYG